MNTYKIYWRWRDRDLGSFALYAALTDEERQLLSLSLLAIQDHVDVARFRMDKVDAELVNEPVVSCREARHTIATVLGISALS